MVDKNTQFVLLIVDDEPDIRDVLRDTLEATCDKIFFADNGRVALEMVMKGLRPDAILSDLNMPQMNGLTLLAELNDLGLNTPFVFLSGFGNEQTQNESKRLGGFAFLEKPFELEQLIQTVASALKIGSKIKEVELEILSTPPENRKSPHFKALENELDQLIKTRATGTPTKKVS